MSQNYGLLDDLTPELLEAESLELLKKIDLDLFESVPQLREHNPLLFIISENYHLKDLSCGYLIVSKNAKNINGSLWDFGIAVSKSNFTQKGFYTIPHLYLPSSNPLIEIEIEIEKEFYRTCLSRYLVSTNENELPLLFDVSQDGNISVTTYYVASKERLREEGKGGTNLVETMEALSSQVYTFVTS